VLGRCRFARRLVEVVEDHGVIRTSCRPWSRESSPHPANARCCSSR
jgi:hypothetical protein